MRDWGLDFIYTAVPKPARVVAAFARRVGFQPLMEGSGRVIWQMAYKDLHDVKPTGEVTDGC